MKYIIGLWVVVMGGIVTFVFVNGFHPKPITKIKVSHFDSQSELAVAIQQRLFFEIKDVERVRITSLHQAFWTSRFVDAFSSVSGKPTEFEAYGTSFEREDSSLKIILVDFTKVGDQPESCVGLVGEKKYLCHSNGMKWKMKKKSESANKVVAHMEQVSERVYVVYVKSRQNPV